jgi:hypothetical protein
MEAKSLTAIRSAIDAHLTRTVDQRTTASRVVRAHHAHTSNASRRTTGEPMSLILYGGSEASRLYHGEFVVRSWFHWPDGTPGEHDTTPLPYEDCLAWLAAAPHTPLIASDGAHLHQVRVERAVIVPAAAA